MGAGEPAADKAMPAVRDPLNAADAAITPVDAASLDEAFDVQAAVSRGEIEPVVQRFRDLHRAYHSLMNVVAVYRRQLDAVREQTLHSAQIADFARKLNVAEIDRIADVIMADIPRMTGAQAGALYLCDLDTRLVSLFRAAPDPGELPPLHLENDRDRIFVHLLRHHRAPFHVQSRDDYALRSGRTFRPYPGEAILDGGALLCPLQIDAMDMDPIPVGILILAGKPGGFHRHDVERAAMIGEMVAAALNTARLLRRMSVLAETDGLTSLYNHRHFQQELDRAIALVRRYGEPLSLALLDIDWFKSVNDTHGHQFGDHVLREVARTIKASVRDKVDIVARYGGEEFAVIMPSTDTGGALLTAERIRANVQKMELRDGDQAVTVTISCGVATYANELEKGAYIDMADMALYRAKNNGRNRVEAGGEPSTDPECLARSEAKRKKREAVAERACGCGEEGAKP